MSKPKPKSKNKQFLDEDCVKYVQIDDVDSVDKYITRAKVKPDSSKQTPPLSAPISH